MQLCIKGGGGKAKNKFEGLSRLKNLTSENKSILELSMACEDKVPIRNFLKVVRLAFSYEAWDFFKHQSNFILDFLQVSNI